MPYQAEYIWLDGYKPTALLRSKTKILKDDVEPTVGSLPIWGFDGSSTEQATGDHSDCVLQPVFTCPDPIRGGNNIHATDVEAVLYQHPAVQEASVASIPHDVLGEDVGAWIVLVEGADATEADIAAWCEERLSDYKRPRRITFVSELPRNATGKVVKKDLPGR